ncbi:hypothetical protein LTR10_014047 [Elasticomyces elasticus]|uniref:Uncharacterized protein n=1 Tax=Exophiala sideris TaxID=1016849 RepID=A0ABR0J4V8_9EURO|nr:hypothetical protein LTR10_014047 [Elasticomyces elasticus]KAK5026453.1 hypothetical protein LTS07_007387 [Exophiala sideris]KAK5033805.1 hypothetical protein LTR13_006857 [Exophiala sideris]KAK5055627.1 hypothetical protein LTR69_008460 [Exophiala sideris]KAK5179988.1 hypothetical protein LTR44_007464 [Eurotiomycetes sp. CCFEE 6388]
MVCAGGACAAPVVAAIVPPLDPNVYNRANSRLKKKPGAKSSGGKRTKAHKGNTRGVGTWRHIKNTRDKIQEQRLLHSLGSQWGGAMLKKIMGRIQEQNKSNPLRSAYLQHILGFQQLMPFDIGVKWSEIFGQSQAWPTQSSTRASLRYACINVVALEMLFEGVSPAQLAFFILDRSGLGWRSRPRQTYRVGYAQSSDSNSCVKRPRENTACVWGLRILNMKVEDWTSIRKGQCD